MKYECVLLCAYLSSTSLFSCQVHLQNPSAKPLVYRAVIRGGDAGDFSIAKGRETITVRTAVACVCCESVDEDPNV